MGGIHPALIAIPLCLVFMVVFTWVAHNMLVSWAGGWGRLSAAYEASGPPARTTWPGCSAWLGGRANYKGVLEIGVSDRGLHLTAAKVYRFGHPPLLVPWGDLEVGPDASDHWGDYTPFAIPALDGLTLKVYSTMRQDLRAAKEAADGA